MVRIAAAGIGLVDIYPQQGKMFPGGNEYNVSCYVSELGGFAAFMGVFAPDKVGSILETVLQEKGVDVSHSQHVQGYSNYALVELHDGNRVFIDWSRTAVTDCNPICFATDDIEYLKTFDVTCVGYASRIALQEMQKLHQNGIDICHDFSDSFNDELINSIAPLLKFAFFSASHLEAVEVQKLLEQVQKLGPRVVVATMGEKGSVAYDGHQYYNQSAIDTKVVDTMGAGDSYLAAFLFNYLRCLDRNDGLAIPNAMEDAAQFAAANIGRQGSLGISFDVDTSHLAEILNI